MSVSKFKALLITSIIGSAGLAAPAYAQLTTEDSDSNSYLEDIREEARDFRDDHIRPHYQSQITHYEEEIKRLDAMIKSLSYYNSEGAYVAPQNRPHLEIVASGDALDTQFRNILEGNANNEGLQITFPNEPESGGILGETLGAVATALLGTDPTSKYLKDHGFVPPGNLYKEDSSNEKRLNKLYSALYVSDNMVGSLLETREARLGTYTLLRTEAKNTQNVQQAIEVNNAILLENGRNLALIIDLEMAKLNAEAANLRTAAQAKNITKDAFGSSALGTVALGAISGLVNDVTTVGDDS